MNDKLKLTNSSSIALDLIRACSSQIVLIGHSLSFFEIVTSNDEKNNLLIQNFGVLIFYILSGFLISYSTFNKLEGSYNFKNYFVDRFVRIYSAYLPILILIFLFDFFVFSFLLPQSYPHFESLNLKTFLGNLFMLQDFQLFKAIEFTKSLHISSLGSGRPLWTLALEWWFYMFFGWFVLFDKTKLNFYVKLLILIVLSIVPILNITFSPRGNCLGFIWFLGFFVFLLLKNKIGQEITASKLKIIIFVLIGLLILRVFSNHYDFYDFRVGFITASILFFTIVLFQNREFLINNKLVTLIKKTSDYSFSLYLIHYSIVEFYVNYFGKENKLLSMIITFFLCNILALLIANYTEFRHKIVRNFIRKKYKI